MSKSKKSKNPKTVKSVLDDYRDEVVAWYLDGVATTEIIRRLAARGIHTSNRSLGRARDRWGVRVKGNLEQPGVHAKENGELTLTSTPSSQEHPLTVEDLLREHGCDPDEYIVPTITIGVYEAQTKTEIRELRQLKISVRRKLDIDPPPFAYHPVDYQPPKTASPKRSKDQPLRYVIFSDHHAPHIEESLHKLACRWLAEYQPDHGIINGDFLDYPDVSRYLKNPIWHATPEECIDSGYRILLDYTHSSPHTKWQMLLGNHDDRLRKFILQNAPQLAQFRQAAVPNAPAPLPFWKHAIALRLFEFDPPIECVETEGEYFETKIAIGDHLAVHHGYQVAQGAAKTAHNCLSHLRYSVMIGHTHRLGKTAITTHTIDNKVNTIYAVETGCMCLIPGGLGHSVNPDWQNGWGLATLWPDGEYSVDTVQYYVNQKGTASLTWSGQRMTL